MKHTVFALALLGIAISCALAQEIKVDTSVLDQPATDLKNAVQNGQQFIDTAKILMKNMKSSVRSKMAKLYKDTLGGVKSVEGVAGKAKDSLLASSKTYAQLDKATKLRVQELLIRLNSLAGKAARLAKKGSPAAARNAVAAAKAAARKLKSALKKELKRQKKNKAARALRKQLAKIPEDPWKEVTTLLKQLSAPDAVSKSLKKSYAVFKKAQSDCKALLRAQRKKLSTKFKKQQKKLAAKKAAAKRKLAAKKRRAMKQLAKQRRRVQKSAQQLKRKANTAVKTAKQLMKNLKDKVNAKSQPPYDQKVVKSFLAKLHERALLEQKADN